MAIGRRSRARIPPFLMAIMVGNGAHSGALSPFAPTGIIVTGLMMKNRLGGHEFWTTSRISWARNGRVHRVLRTGRMAALSIGIQGGLEEATDARFDAANWTTLASSWLSWRQLSSSAQISEWRHSRRRLLLAATRVADHDQAVRRMPWSPILMVSGVTVLISCSRRRAVSICSRRSWRGLHARTATGAVAFVTGVISSTAALGRGAARVFCQPFPGLVMPSAAAILWRLPHR
jgi:hypothetical protein